MSNPFAINPSGTVIQGQGDGTAIAQGLAGVLGQMQQQKENQFRMQQLQQQQAEQQALQQYYQAQAANQSRELDLKAGSQAIEREGLRQVGGAERAAMGQPGVFQDALNGGAQSIGGQQGYERIFGGVSDENLPAAIAGVRAMQPKPEEPPTSVKEYNFVKYLSQIDPSGNAAKAFIDNWVKKPGVTVNNNAPPAETAFAVEDAKNQAGALKAAEESARSAASAMPSIDEAYDTLSRGKAYLGLGAKQKLFAGRIASALGVPSEQIRVADTQTLWRLTGETTLKLLGSRALGSGTAVSDNDRQYMLGIAGQDLSQDPLSLRKIMRINFGTLILNQADAIAQLRAQASDPSNRGRAPSLMRREQALNAQYQSGWKRYAKMLAGEGIAQEEIMDRMRQGGVSDIDRIMRGLPKPTTAPALTDSLFPVR